MFKIYTICVPKRDADFINGSPYNLITTLSGDVYLEETTKEELNNFVYYLLEELDYKSINGFQDNIVLVGVDEIRKLDGKIYVK